MDLISCWNHDLCQNLTYVFASFSCLANHTMQASPEIYTLLEQANFVEAGSRKLETRLVWWRSARWTHMLTMKKNETFLPCRIMLLTSYCVIWFLKRTCQSLYSHHHQYISVKTKMVMYFWCHCSDVLWNVCFHLRLSSITQEGSD